MLRYPAAGRQPRNSPAQNSALNSKMTVFRLYFIQKINEIQHKLLISELLVGGCLC